MDRGERIDLEVVVQHMAVEAHQHGRHLVIQEVDANVLVASDALSKKIEIGFGLLARFTIHQLRKGILQLRVVFCS